MRCIVPGPNVKIIARAINSLSKIGDEVTIEPTGAGLIFRTVNMAQSAFADFKMNLPFFSSYSFDETDNGTFCKVTMKSFLAVFKSAHCMDRQAESCEIRMKPNGTAVVLQIKFASSRVKKHVLPTLDSDLSTVAVPGQSPNQLILSAKFLAATVKNFRNSEDELTWTVTKDNTAVKNHLELRRDQMSMRTELFFHPSEFETYSVQDSTSLTFCFRELRAVLAFAEPSNLLISMNFETPGKPILFQVANLPAYESNYIIGTLSTSHSDFNATVMRSRHVVSFGNSGIDQPGPSEPMPNLYADSDDVRPEPEVNEMSAIQSIEAGSPPGPRIVPPSSSQHNLSQRPISTEEKSPQPRLRLSFQSVSQREENLSYGVVPETEPSLSSQAPLGSDDGWRQTNRFDPIPESEPSQSQRPSQRPPHTSVNDAALSDGVYSHYENNSGVFRNAVSVSGSTGRTEANERVEQNSTNSELVRIVFNRCFNRTNLLDSLPGSKDVIYDDSDSEQ